MSKLTSEKIAKALKGAGLDSKQRIEKAYEAWTDDAVYFPNKSSFLFDWICSAFAKPNMKKLNDCCLIQLPYWNLLHELLQHYHEKGNSSLKPSIPTIHVNFVSSISILLQQLYNDPIKNALERTELLSIAHKCLAILFSSTFTLSYRPAFEHISTAVDQILTVLATQIDLYFSNGNNKEQEVGALQQLALMARILLNKYDSQLVLAANQKKV
ncbi:MAG: hypothetical protein EXX96DRAFT_223600 [Benjaminiella poitrasii]|nr:MAG: hypothetical protein EXX96DRAFT_223600 [Benjaminiella poitrasii]